MAVDGSEVTASRGIRRACSVCGDVVDESIALNRRVWLCVRCGDRVGRAAGVLRRGGTNGQR